MVAQQQSRLIWWQIFTVLYFPSLPYSGMQMCTRGESLVSFLKWALHNLKRTRVFRAGGQHLGHCSASYAFNVRCVWYLLPDSWTHVASCLLPLHFFLFWAFGFAHMQLRSFYPLSALDAAHVRKIPGSLYLHNFNVHIPEWGSLGTRLLWLMVRAL